MNQEVNQRRETEGKRTALSIIVEIVVLFLIAYILASFWGNYVIGNFIVGQHSMEPTLYENERLLVNRVIYYFKPPQRGDIVILLDPVGGEKDFVKRIIAGPGDVIEIKNGRTYLNSKPINEPYVNGNVSGENFGPFRVPADYYFVMGDNRPVSSDSRSFGPVPRKNILGKVFLVWWPPSRIHVPR